MRPPPYLHFLALATVFGLVVVLLAPGCGRSSLELEIPREASAGVAPNCGPATCPEGCCDSAGVCRTGHDNRACGSIGERCSDCVADGFATCNDARVCGRDQPGCRASNCDGCCTLDQGRTRCLSGTEPAACGKTGEACTTCTTSGRICDAITGACGTTSCNPSNCAGCCVGDKCLPGDQASACGTAGGACTTCDPGQSCTASPSGGGGGTCQGESLCNPSSCAGCCTPNGQCVAGHDTTACGHDGAACVACPGDQTCVPDNQPNARSCQPHSPCGPDTCSGCCVDDQCVIATTAKSCGIKGAACTTCDPSSVCNTATGTCVTAGSCNTGNCPGCCVGDICAVGTQDTACGTGGQLCSNCVNQAPVEVCQAGACQPPTCGPDNCKTGCCQNNVCVLGTQDSACGATGGGQCTDCTQTGDVCVARSCQAKCGSGNCTNGCCQSDNSCASGVANDACGGGGASCVNCQQQGSFCNGLVVPRRCNDQQSTCPASWGACPAGITTAVTAPAQGVCAANEISTFSADCTGGENTPLCQSAIGAIGDPCAACMKPFLVPFELHSGLWACAASFVNGPCRRQTGCAAACLDTSCSQCSAPSENQCVTLVTGPAAQCNPNFAAANVCTRDALDPGQLCSQFSYADFGAWLRAVGTHFCGNGP